jgi:hypothetical protein
MVACRRVPPVLEHVAVVSVRIRKRATQMQFWIKAHNLQNQEPEISMLILEFRSARDTGRFENSITP